MVDLVECMEFMKCPDLWERYKNDFIGHKLHIIQDDTSRAVLDEYFRFNEEDVFPQDPVERWIRLHALCNVYVFDLLKLSEIIRTLQKVAPIQDPCKMNLRKYLKTITMTRELGVGFLEYIVGTLFSAVVAELKSEQGIPAKWYQCYVDVVSPNIVYAL